MLSRYHWAVLQGGHQAPARRAARASWLQSRGAQHRSGPGQGDRKAFGRARGPAALSSAPPWQPHPFCPRGRSSAQGCGRGKAGPLRGELAHTAWERLPVTSSSPASSEPMAQRLAESGEAPGLFQGQDHSLQGTEVSTLLAISCPNTRQRCGITGEGQEEVLVATRRGTESGTKPSPSPSAPQRNEAPRASHPISGRLPLETRKAGCRNRSSAQRFLSVKPSEMPATRR